MEGPLKNPEEIPDQCSDVRGEWQRGSQDSLQTAVIGLWTKIFKSAHIGLDDNFFELGGDSLRGMELMEKVSERLGFELDVMLLFQNPTPRELTGAIRVLDHESVHE